MRCQVAEYLAHRQSRIVATRRNVAAMKKDEAKHLIIQEWDKWAASNLIPDNEHTSGDAEPPREPRRLIGLSHAAIACSSGLA
jgi:hypothetical protein